MNALRPASQARLMLEAAVYAAKEHGVEPETIRKIVEDALETYGELLRLRRTSDE